MKKMIVLITLISLLLMTGCAAKPKTLVDAEAVEVVACGRLLSVIDRQAGNNYDFRVVRVRRSDAVVEAVEVMSTPTMTIRQARHSVIIDDRSKVYIITIDGGGHWNAEKG